MPIQKATHEERIEMFAPIIEEYKGKYVAVLSDDSIDRDGERVGKAAFQKIVQRGGYIAAMLDHKNEALNQVGNWINPQMKTVDGVNVLIAEPEFFMSNPKAQIVKGMLDDGAKMGISIGAIVKEYEDTKINGNTVRTFTDLELLEASFVGIPSNRYGRALAVAKSFKNATQGDNKVEKEYTKKDLDEAVEKVKTESTAKIEELDKRMKEKDSEIEKLKKDLEEKEEEVEEKDKELSEEKSKTEDLSKKSEALVKEAESAKAEVDKVKKQALQKQNLISPDSKNYAAMGVSDDEIDKSFDAGKLPITHM